MCLNSHNIRNDIWRHSLLKSKRVVKINQSSPFRSSCLQMFFKIGVLKIFAKFTGKHLCRSLFFNRITNMRPATLLKKRLRSRCFPVNFSNFLGKPFFKEHLRCLLLPLYLYFPVFCNISYGILKYRNKGIISL